MNKNWKVRIRLQNPVFEISFLFFFSKILFIYFYRRGEREGEKHQCVVASCTPHAGDLAHNLDLCPDWESNPQPFGS